MRVAILSESSADEAALRILVDAALGIGTEAVSNLPLRSRGYPAVRNVLSTVIKFLHYKTDAEGLVAVVDSDHSSVLSGAQRNRLDELRQLADRTLSVLGSMAGRPRLRVAIGVASPAIEAWLLYRDGSEISEAAWENGLKDRREPYSKRALKKRLYRVEYADLARETECMVEAAKGISADLGLLERAFPTGFGQLVSELRGWRSF